MKRLLEIQQKLKCNKAQVNKFGGYNYRSCEDILEAVKPLLAEQQCIIKLKDEVVTIGDRYYVKATVALVDLDGKLICETTAFAREEETKKGMDGSQITGASSSYARKYALNGMFAIDDTVDMDRKKITKSKAVTKPENEPEKKQEIFIKLEQKDKLKEKIGVVEYAKVMTACGGKLTVDKFNELMGA